MALQPLKTLLYYPSRVGALAIEKQGATGTGRVFAAEGESNSRLNALNEILHQVGVIEWEGGETNLQISKVHVRVGTVGTNLVAGSGTLRVGIQPVTVAGKIGSGSWTIYGDVSTDLTANAPLSVTMTGGTLSTQYSSGDLVSIAVQLVSTSTANVDINTLGGADAHQDPFVWGPTGASVSAVPCVLLESTTGKFGVLRGAGWVGATSELSFNSGSGANENGIILRPPFKCRCLGMWMLGNPVNTSVQMTANIYQGSAAVPGSALQSRSVGTDILGTGTTAGRFGQVFWTTPQTLNAGSDYIVALKADTTNNWEMPQFSFGISGAERASAGGSNSYRVSRSGAGAFTEDTAAWHPMGVIIDQLDDGVSSGGGALFIDNTRGTVGY